ncbi:ArsR family transcriptional regulator [Clostridioides sp. ZZV14-6345]|nr:ArsR family transcriptional regulator [Clostridioides sp. ZZV14-6345]
MKKKLYVCDLVEYFNVPQSKLSYHYVIRC